MSSSGTLQSGISVVVPAFESRHTLPDLPSRLLPVLGRLAEKYELILVNDGSRDKSWEVIRDLTSSHDWVRGIDLTRNYGQHNALLCGIRAARYDVIVTMDDDLQHPPEEIFPLVEKLNEGYDVVYGTPIKQPHEVWRNLASRVSKLTLRIAMESDMARHVSAFRALRTSLREAFSTYRNPHVSIDVLLSWGTTRFAGVPVRHDSRRLGRSSYTFGKLLVHALNMMTGFTSWPLRLASVTGFVFTLFGFAVLLFVVGRYLIEGGSVPGFPFLASVIAIFSGAQLFAIGIIGEYLARIFQHTMDRPVYLVRSVAGENHRGEGADTPGQGADSL